MQKSAHSRQNTALSFCREERLPLREALPSSRFPLPNITNAPHRGLFRTGARRPLINCFLPARHYCCVYTSLTLCCYCFCTRPRNLTATVKTNRETSPAWRSQQRLTLVPTSPHQVYLPGGASSPALCIPHLPLPLLPSLLEASTACACSLTTTASSTLHLFLPLSRDLV